MIRILIVDDSKTEIALLQAIFSQEPDMKIVGSANHGAEAIKLAQQLKPDIITMDIMMPVMDGIAAIQTIMATNPVPIVVISSKANDKALNMTFRALEAGALSVLEKPIDFLHASFEPKKRIMIETIRNMAAIHVFKRRFATKKSLLPLPKITKSFAHHHYEILAIGTSVGGPQALKAIFSELSDDFPLPIVVVQHMTPGFIQGFTDYLRNITRLKVKLAEDHEKLRAGTVYFAPDKKHLVVTKINNILTAQLQQGAPVSGFCPSATVLLQSVTKACGKNAIGMLLTGMGNDGAQGLLELKTAQGHTLIQDSESSVVFGMAGVAQSLGAVDTIVELEQIANYLQKITQETRLII